MRRKALVIGANRGIGREIAVRLASDGFRICVSGRNLEQLEEGVVPECRKAGAESVETLVFDMTDAEAVRKEYERVFGDDTPDVAVYNAGCGRLQRRMQCRQSLRLHG